VALFTQALPADLKVAFANRHQQGARNRPFAPVALSRAHRPTLIIAQSVARLAIVRTA